MEKTLRIIAMVVLLINGVSALWGGFGLMYYPSGAFMQMPLHFLKHTPFSTYFVPGLILFVANGLLSLVAFFFTLKRQSYSSYLILLQGLVLAIWLTVQILMIREFYPPLHLPFYTIALILIILGALLIRNAKA